MDSIQQYLASQPAVTLFVIMAVGLLVGHIKLAGFSLGPSGVLFVALAFGHFQIILPQVLTGLGTVLFVYAVGLQAGPRFVSAFRRRGITLASITLITLIGTALAAVLVAYPLGIKPALVSGLFAGALTSTPGLAASLETLQTPDVSVGYGIAYPFGILGIVVFAQLLPRWLDLDLKASAAELEASQKPPRVTSAWFRVINAQLAGLTVREIGDALPQGVVLCRISNEGTIRAALHDVNLDSNTLVRATGTVDQLRRLEFLLGPRSDDYEEPRSTITSRDLVVTEQAVTGQTLHEMRFNQRYGVNISRLWRDEFEVVPDKNTRLEYGDIIRIVGDVHDCERIGPLVGHSERRIQETRFLPFSLGIVLGVIIGAIPMTLPGGTTAKLGMAGGPLFAGLVLGHLGHLGSMSFRVPFAAKFFIREAGLMMFLAGAGTSAGQDFVSVVAREGITLFLAGAVMTVVPLLIAFPLAHYVFRLDILTALGGICGAMTSTPGLGAVCEAADSESPALAYATVYPIALIAVTILAPLLPTIIEQWGR
ncbi:Aspartate/alanine antiporter [Planctomycetes bacterium Pan216]|uniref:Aspartate/alanine antiporter n=1 Tax=Kolteria novifilia TaxID=2527975 RepID=A0A518B937_9BACT|nr:Aspartate/alanine antiporter [Planctomycetes bacterium Pan216]